MLNGSKSGSGWPIFFFLFEIPSSLPRLYHQFNSEEVNFPVFSFVQLLSSKMKAFAVRFSKLIRFSPTYLL
ncbi:hypothetical protein AtNW77_Chr3g0160611 [Arabidopsis thaliana]